MKVYACFSLVTSKAQYGVLNDYHDYSLQLITSAFRLRAMLLGLL